MNDRSGFTLIEVIAALVVFAVGVVIATNLTEALARGMEHAAARSEAVSVAEHALDSLSAVPYDELPVGETETHEYRIQGRTFLRVDEVVQVGPRLRQIQVEVAPENGGTPRFEGVGYVVAPW